MKGLERVFGNKLVLVFTLVLFLLRARFFFTRVVGQSMEPTLKQGDRLLVSSYPLSYKTIQRGDLVLMADPRARRRYYIKRVIGLGGEKLILEDGCLCIDGQKTSIPERIFFDRQGKKTLVEETIPQGQIYLLGDNYPQSVDSRSFGSVEIKDLRGRVAFRLLPLERMGPIQRKRILD